MRNGQIVEVPLSLLDRPVRPHRSVVDKGPLEELVESMAKRGLLQPIGAKPVNGRWEVVWGDRRTQAARELGWEKIKAVVVLGDERRLFLDRAHENLVRADLSPIEEAELCRALLEEAGGDIERAARLVGRSVGWVDGRLDMLRWPADLQEAVDSGQISRAAARPLVGVTDDEERKWLVRNAIEF